MVKQVINLLCVICFGGILLSGCTDNSNHVEEEEEGSGCQETEGYNCQQDAEASIIQPSKNLEEGYSFDWGWDEIYRYLEHVKYYPSRDPLDYAVLADKIGCTQEYLIEQISLAEDRLLSIPEIIENTPSDIMFYTEDSELQFRKLPWDSYHFEEVDNHVINGTIESGFFFGCACLKGYVSNLEEVGVTVFISYFYDFKSQRITIMETVETENGIADYNVFCDWDYVTDNLYMEQYPCIRLLDGKVDLNPCEKILPVPNMEGEALKCFIGRVFLDIVRFPEHLGKYENLFTEDTLSILKTLECYYEKPNEIYDCAVIHMNKDGTGRVSIESQFWPSLWGDLLIYMEICFVYDQDTGMISVKTGQMFLAEKP